MKFRHISWEVDAGTTNPDATQKTISFTKEFILDKDIDRIMGFQLFLNNGNPIGRASMGLDINGKQIYPEDMQIVMLYNNDLVAAKDRWVMLNGAEGILAGNGKIFIRYKDEYNPYIPFPSADGVHYRYKVKMALLCK